MHKFKKPRFSINELEKYLGEPIPVNAQQIDTDLWRIELSKSNFIRQNIKLLSKDDLIIAAEYLFNIIDEHGEKRTLNNNVINWELKPDGELKNTKYLLIGLTNLNSRGIENNEIWNFSVLILDLNN